LERVYDSRGDLIIQYWDVLVNYLLNSIINIIIIHYAEKIKKDKKDSGKEYDMSIVCHCIYFIVKVLNCLF
jgi:hypothetical protein